MDKLSEERWRKKFIEVEKDILDFFKRHPLAEPDGSFVANMAKQFDCRKVASKKGKEQG